MAGPSKTIDAAMFAAAIGVHRAVKRQIGRAVEAERRAGPLHPDLGAQQPFVLWQIPAIVDGNTGFAFKPARRIVERTIADVVALHRLTNGEFLERILVIKTMQYSE